MSMIIELIIASLNQIFAFYLLKRLNDELKPDVEIRFICPSPTQLGLIRMKKKLSTVFIHFDPTFQLQK